MYEHLKEKKKRNSSKGSFEMREISPSSPWLLKERENTLKVLKKFSTVLTVPCWETHAIFTVPQAVVILNMWLDIQLIISEYSKRHSHKPTYLIRLFPNATNPTVFLTLTIPFPTSFIPLSCWADAERFWKPFQLLPCSKEKQVSWKGPTCSRISW